MRGSLVIVIVASCLGLSGCAKQASNAADDSTHAKYILVTALEAWRSGQVATLSTRTPPIRFSDDDQKAGCQLINYEFEDEAAPIIPFQNVPMLLSLRDRQGGVSQKNATYQIGTEPVLTVLRSDN